MKKYCKHIDITDRALISRAARACLTGGKNGRSKLSRMDTLRMFHEYSGAPISLLKKIAKDRQYHMFDGIIETVIDGIHQEILDGKFSWKPIWYTQKRENGKLRRIGIQDIKQQLYDYIAVEGLAEALRKKIGYYQCAAIPGKGQTMGMRAVKRWLRNKGLRYAWKGDASHYYENIDIARLKELLERYVGNRPLLRLVSALLDSFEKGLSIGSYLSQYLANFYMSFAYHHASENLFKIRRKRNGTAERTRLVKRALIYMDDILFIGSSLKDLKMAVKRFREWIWDKLHISLKEGDRYINLRDGHIDMMGFLISRKKVITRGRIFRRYRKDIRQVRKTGILTRRRACRIISRDGWLTNAQCSHWRKRNKADMITKLAKEMIRNGKDVVYLSEAGRDDHGSSGRQKGRDGPDRGRGGDPGRGHGNGEDHDVSIRRKQFPDGARGDGGGDPGGPGEVSEL